MDTLLYPRQGEGGKQKFLKAPVLFSFIRFLFLLRPPVINVLANVPIQATLPESLGESKQKQIE